MDAISFGSLPITALAFEKQNNMQSSIAMAATANEQAVQAVHHGSAAVAPPIGGTTAALGLSRRLPRALRRLISECVQTHALLIAVAHQTAIAPHQLAPSPSLRCRRRRPAVWKLRRSAEQQAMPRLHRLGLHRLLLAPRPVERLAMERPTIPPSSPRRC